MDALKQFITDYCKERYADGYDFIECLDLDYFIQSNGIHELSDVAIALDKFAVWWRDRQADQSSGEGW